MNAAEGSARSLASTETHAALGNQWRALRRAATVVSLLASPAVYVWLHDHVGWSVGWSIAAALGLVIVMRGAMDPKVVVRHKHYFVPASMTGAGMIVMENQASATG